MQTYGSVVTDPVAKTTQNTQRPYWEFRIKERHMGTTDPGHVTYYTVRLFRDGPSPVAKGDFALVAGTLMAGAYLDRNQQPAAALTILTHSVKKVEKQPAKDGDAKASAPAAEPGKPATAEPPALATAGGPGTSWGTDF